MDLAAGELADPATDPGRRADVQDFVALAGRELAQLVRRTSREVDGIQEQVSHVQLILADQQRFSRAERVIESVALPRLLEETVRLLPEALRDGVRVEVDPEVHQTPPVRTSRVALQQVLTNLLINAAEAVAEAGRPGPGLVRVSAQEEVRDETPVVHLRFADDGAGIAPEHLPRIFESGFSTKGRGSGMGLHWCANTVVALGGRLYAESDGPGRGACLNLLLPRAVPQKSDLEDAA
jgi:C4-dicarboxylate-specific signal transduction histidine kinase